MISTSGWTTSNMTRQWLDCALWFSLFFFCFPFLLVLLSLLHFVFSELQSSLFSMSSSSRPVMTSSSSLTSSMTHHWLRCLNYALLFTLFLFCFLFLLVLLSLQLFYISVFSDYNPHRFLSSSDDLVLYASSMTLHWLLFRWLSWFLSASCTV